MFFGIGFWECVVVLMVAFLVFPTKQLPEIAQRLGHWVRSLRQFSNELKKDEI